jgi:hypothetical protein
MERVMQATQQLPAIAATIDQPIVTPGKAARCATCEVRARSVCSAIPHPLLGTLVLSTLLWMPILWWLWG